MQDVILPRVLDDQTFGTLNSIILFNNVAVSGFCRSFGMLCCPEFFGVKTFKVITSMVPTCRSCQHCKATMSF